MRLHHAALLSIPFALALAACKPAAEAPKPPQTGQPAASTPATEPATTPEPGVQPLHLVFDHPQEVGYCFTSVRRAAVGQGTPGAEPDRPL